MSPFSNKKFKLVTFLGIRPDIIRTRRLIGMLDQGQKKFGYEHVYVHSGQHFDYQLDGVFRKQLGVRRPDLDLRIGKILKRTRKTSHVHQSALLFTKTAEMLEKLRPHAVLYLGDTNTVTSALIVAKYGVPVIHIEGGGRSYDWRMPEEKNRILADHLSDIIYCYLERYKNILLSEGVPSCRAVVVGNIIVDALNDFMPVAKQRSILKNLHLEAKQYALCTIHREENIENRDILAAKLQGLRDLAKAMPVVLPVMPRVQARVRQFRLEKLLAGGRMICTKPLGFLDFLKLESAARVIVTDSGTVQEEALILGVPCLVTRRSTERPETIAAGATILADDDLCANAHRASQMDTGWNRDALNPTGGSPSERIYQDLIEKMRFGFFAQSRTLEMLRTNPFARQAYGLELP
ncbi:MAG: UDP-N-acetylglucosamine 2-epimerase (non-hydrolyzing) [Acidobacteriia bacterium]|nr:UDP-N-acetylglucosamine 2-epimerase (non-hydrolyzing) [Terriglobia bacterium]